MNLISTRPFYLKSRSSTNIALNFTLGFYCNGVSDYQWILISHFRSLFDVSIINAFWNATDNILGISGKIIVTSLTNDVLVIFITNESLNVLLAIVQS